MSEMAPNKALQRTRLSDGCFPWRSVRAAELGRYEAITLKCIAISLALAFPIVGLAEEIKWEQESTVSADIDCDGVQDSAIVGYIEADVVIKLNLGRKVDESSMRFGLGNAGRQDSLCGTKATLTARQSNAEEVAEALGDLPEGYMSKEGCFDLNLRGGECDSINVFWNHQTNELNWWRL